MSNVPSFLTTSCNEGQGKVNFLRIVVGAVDVGMPLPIAAKEKDGLSAVLIWEDLKRIEIMDAILQRALKA